MFSEETIKYIQDNNEKIEKEIIEIGNDFF